MTNYDNQLTQLIDSVNANFQRITSLGPSAALSIGTASGDLDVAKQTVLRNIDDIYALNNSVLADTEVVTTNAKTIGQTLKEARNSTETLKKDVQKNKTLLEIRTAQANALQEKYDANLHTSWLGLWRPLADSTQTALLVVSIVLGLIALVSLGMLLYKYIPVGPGKSESGSGFVGGKRHFSNRN